MDKIIIIGCPGSGKSTFVRKLNQILDYPLYHLDLIWNKPDKTTISREEFDIELEKIFKEDKWIMDGNYQRTLEKRLDKAKKNLKSEKQPIIRHLFLKRHLTFQMLWIVILICQSKKRITKKNLKQ